MMSCLNICHAPFCLLIRCFASCVNNNQQMATNNHSNNVERYEGHLRLNGNIFILKRALNMLCFMLTQSRVFN